jgi:hypothetical protein
MRSGVGDQRSKATGRGLLEARRSQMPSWNPGAKLARLTFRLQGGRAVEQFSTLHFTNSIGEAEPLVFGFLRLGHEITAARL